MKQAKNLKKAYFKEIVPVHDLLANSAVHIQGVRLKSGPYFDMSNLFTKIYSMLYYTTNLYLQ